MVWNKVDRRPRIRRAYWRRAGRRRGPLPWSWRLWNAVLLAYGLAALAAYLAGWLPAS